MHFTDETMQTILPRLKERLKEEAYVTFDVLDPDVAECYAGTPVTIGETTYLYRSYKSWMELAELLGCRMLTPKPAEHPRVRLCFKKLGKDSFHQNASQSAEEKYGAGSPFWQINKLEEPAFLHYYLQALQNAGITRRRRILDLGVHRGDEYLAIKSMLEPEYPLPEFVGIDHSASAIADAKRRFGEKSAHFIQADINKLDQLSLGRFDLLISIGTLQSPGIAYKPLLMQLVQNHLAKEDAAVILGFPNCRWIGGEMLYGAKVPNYAMSEMGHLYSDVIFAKKYLQQKRFRVTVTGKHYIFVTATKIAGSR